MNHKTKEEKEQTQQNLYNRIKTLERQLEIAHNVYSMQADENREWVSAIDYILETDATLMEMLVNRRNRLLGVRRGINARLLNIDETI